MAEYHTRVVAITRDYLGPAAERFINRQIDFHIGKPPDQINKDDVAHLRESVRVALGLLVEDKRLVAEAVAKFDALLKE